MYSKEKELEAIELKDVLKTAGYEINCSGRSKQIERTEIVGYNSSISKKIIKTLKEKVPALSHYEFVHQPVRHFCSSSDIVITIKEDKK